MPLASAESRKGEQQAMIVVTMKTEFGLIQTGSFVCEFRGTTKSHDEGKTTWSKFTRTEIQSSNVKIEALKNSDLKSTGKLFQNRRDLFRGERTARENNLNYIALLFFIGYFRRSRDWKSDIDGKD
jgi:hypothetical protein